MEETEENYPCIYGKAIQASCPVRDELSKSSKIDISKYLTPKMGSSDPQSLRMIEQMSTMMSKMNEAMNTGFTTLQKFCETCPYKHKFQQ